MRKIVSGFLVLVPVLLAGCVTNEGAGGADRASPASAQTPAEALAACVERTKTISPSAMQSARQIMRVKTNEEAAPLLCTRLTKALAEGRIDHRDLKWDDGPNPQSKRLIRALQTP